MDLSVLKKKLSVYRAQDGSLKNISDELLYELLVSWESWEGSSKEFFSVLGSSGTQMASVIGRAKRYKREGRFGSSEFKELVIEGQQSDAASSKPILGSPGGCSGIEFVWPDGRMVRFSDLDKLLEFMKRTA